jgi:hypothetical protein
MPFEWEDCLKEGEEAFQYMIHHYDDMLDGDRVKHFDIWYATYWMQSYYDDVKALYGKEIQVELAPWIKNEFESKRLFEPTLWKPFRDGDSPNYINMGYKKLFVYKNYYFQLQIETTCSDCVDCERNENPIHFDIALYGWKDEHSDKVLPYNDVSVLPDYMMPERDWSRK